MAEPGWYPDPTNVGQQRYWDGTTWTGQIAPAKKRPGFGAALALIFLLVVIGVLVAQSIAYMD